MQTRFRMAYSAATLLAGVMMFGAAAPAAAQVNQAPTCPDTTVGPIAEWIDTTVNVYENMTIGRCTDPDGDELEFVSDPVPPYSYHLVPYTGTVYLPHQISDGHGHVVTQYVIIARY